MMGQERADTVRTNLSNQLIYPQAARQEGVEASFVSPRKETRNLEAVHIDFLVNSRAEVRL